MPGKFRILVTVCALMGLVLLTNGSAQANWYSDFEDDAPGWEYLCYPDVTKTFSHTIKTDPNGNKYLSLDETISCNPDGGSYGSAFSAAFGSQEDFTDVRMGAVVNVTGDASRNYCGFSARTTYIIDDGSVSGAPGMFATQTYVMHVNWEEGPANLRIDIEKIVNMSNIMRNEEELGLDLAIPGLDHARSYYAEMDIVGSDPVYITGSLYEYKGGPLVARTATMVDTNGNDPWEDGEHDAVYTSGKSAVFAQHEHWLRLEEPPGYHCTFDDVFSISDGPAAVNLNPADGATDVPINATLSWVEAAFATSRELWFGKEGDMQKIEPAPTGKTYNPGLLKFGQTYQWRVDEIGPAGTVTGHVCTFTTAECMTVDDFESYATDVQIATAWPHNIPGGFQYIFLETDRVYQPSKAMRFEFQNQYDPYFTEATRTFNTPQNWDVGDVKALSLFYRGEIENVEHLMYLKLEDASGHTWKAENPYKHACESESWQQWDIALTEFSDGGVNLASVKKITIGLGDGTNSGQVGQDRDIVYIDQLRLCPARCFNVNQLDLRGDVNGDCKIDFKDLAVMAEGWLNDGLSVVP